MKTAKRLIAIGAITTLGAGAILGATGLVNVDHYAGTYGVSAGTNSNYCSLDIGHWPTCEHAN